MARLDITVRGIDQLSAVRTATGAAGAGGIVAEQQKVTALLERQNRLIGLMGQGGRRFGQEMLRGLQAVDGRLAAQDRRLQMMASRTGLGLQRAAEVGERGFQRLVSRASLGMQRIAEAAERSQAHAIQATERRWAAMFGRVGSRAASALGGLTGGVGRVVGSAGTQLGGVIGGLGSGGLGGFARSAGSIAGVGAQAAFNVPGSMIGGAGRALAGVPYVGPALAGAAGMAQGGLQAAGGVLGGVAQLGGNIAGAAIDSALTAVKVGIAAGIGGAIAAGLRAAKVEPIREAFEGIVQTLGTDAPAAMGRFREATKGTIDDLNIMLQFNRAVQLGAVETTQDFEQLAVSARRLGKALGRDAKDSLEDLALGMGRQSRLILDNLGIIVSAERAYERFAVKIGKTVEALDDAERKRAFNEAALAAIDLRLQRLGPETDTFGDKWNRLTASFLNFLERAGRPLIEVLGEIVPDLTRMGDEVGNFLAANRVQIAEQLRTALGGVRDAIKDAADYIQERGLAGAFEDAKTAALGLWESFKTEAQAALIFVRSEWDVMVTEMAASGQIASSKAATLFGLFGGDRATKQQEELRRDAERRVSLIRSGAQNEIGVLRGSRNAAPAPGPASLPPDSGGGNGGGAPPWVLPGGQAGLRAVGGLSRFGLLAGAAALPGGGGSNLTSRQAAEIDFMGAARRAGIDEPSLQKIQARIGQLSVETINAATETLATAKQELELKKLEKDLLGDQLEIQERLTADQKETASRITDSEREMERLADERVRITEGILGVERDILNLRQSEMQEQHAILDRAAETFRQAVEGLASNFRGSLAGARGDPALPNNIARGFARSDKLEDRAIKKQLRLEFGHISSGTIARDPDIQAQMEARAASLRVGAIRPHERARDRAAEEAFPETFKPEIGELAEKGRAETDKALAELATVTAEAEKTMEKTIEASVALLESTTKLGDAWSGTHEVLVSKLTSIDDRIKTMERETADLKRVVQSLK